MELVLNIDKVVKENEKIYGVFFFKKNNEFYFPSSDWNDFILVVFTWWSESLIKLLSRETLCEYLEFMDGDFRVKIEYNKPKQFKLLFIKGDELKGVQEVNSKKFIENFTEKMGELLFTIKGLNFCSSDLENLEKNYKRLQLIKGNVSN